MAGAIITYFLKPRPFFASYHLINMPIVTITSYNKHIFLLNGAL